MAHRRFRDRDGLDWEIRTHARAEWEFGPVGDNPGPARTVARPGYERDPYELSVEELQGLLDGARAYRPRQVKNPFKD